MSGMTLRAALGAAFAAIAAHTALAQDATPMNPIVTTEPIIVGDLTIAQGWARATPPGAVTGAGYLTITNNGLTDDILVAVVSPIAAINEVHMMTMDSDRMQMRPLEDGLIIPAGETIVLQPGGIHLMFVQLNEPIVEGLPVPVTLMFANAGQADLALIVYPIGSDGPAGVMEGIGGMEGMGGMGDAGGGM